MAYIDTENIPLHMPVPGTREPAQIALLNENCVALSLHDHTDGKALAIGRLRSGLEASRPAAGSAGNVYFSTDTGRFWADTGTAWVGFITEGGQATVTGWTLIDPVIRDTLQFGPEGSATIDNNITRTGANALRTDSNLGVGVAPAAWDSGRKALQVGPEASLVGANTGGLGLWQNTYYAGTTHRSMTTASSTKVGADGGVFRVETAPSVAAGAAQTFATRLQVAQSGQTTINADWGPPSLVITNPAGAHFGGGNVATFHNSYPGIQIAAMTFWSNGTNPAAYWSSNSHFAADGTGRHALYGTLTGSELAQESGQLAFRTFAAVAAGAVQTTKEVFKIGTNGTVTLTPDAGVTTIETGPGLAFTMRSASHFITRVGAGAALVVQDSAGADRLIIAGNNGAVYPGVDNVGYCGASVNRWTVVYAVAGTINTSSIEVKEIIGEVDDAVALGQLMGIPTIYRFYYKHNQLVAGTEDEYELVADTSMEFLGPVAEEMPADMKVGDDVTVGSVNTEGHLMASLRGAVKEYRAQINALTERIAALEATSGQAPA